MTTWAQEASVFIFLFLSVLPWTNVYSQDPQDFVLHFVSKQFDVQNGKLFKIYSSGAIEEVSFRFPKVGYGFEGTALTTNPLPSRNGKYVAFIKNFNLWIYDLSTKRAHQATTIGRASDKKYFGNQVIIGDWGIDNEKIIYEVGTASDGSSEGPDLAIRNEKYGWYVFSTASGKNTMVSVAGKFLTWLPKNRCLVQTPKEPKLSMGNRLEIYDFDSQTTTPLLPFKGDFQVSDISQDGNWLLIVSLDWNTYKTDLLKVAIDGARTILKKDSEWTTVEKGRLSPSGRNYSWVTVEERSKVKNLVVNGRPIYTSGGFKGEHRWVSESAIVAFNEDSIVVLDAASGREIGKKATAN